MKKKFRKYLSVCTIAFVLLAAMTFNCFAEEQKQEEDKLAGEVAVSVLSAYIWRGQELKRDSIVVQPSAKVSYKGFTANIWGNLDTRPYAEGENKYEDRLTETDITLSYSTKIGIFQAGAGYIYYVLAAPHSGAPDPLDSQELYIAIGLDTILQPTLTAFKEIDHYHHWYFLMDVSHVFEFNKVVRLKLAASASYLVSTDETTYARYDSNSLATTDKYNNFHDAAITISLPLAVYKSLTVIPTVSYVFPLCNDARYEMKARGLQGVVNPGDRNSTYLYGGITVSMAF